MARFVPLILATALVGTAALVHVTRERPAAATLEVEGPEAEPAVLAYEHAPEQGAAPIDEFAFVVELDGPHLVLATHVPDAWVRGDLDLEAPDTASVDLDPFGIPAELLAWDEVTLYGFDGTPIDTGRVGTPRAISQAAGAWEGDSLDIAEQLWATGARLIVAPIDADADGDAVFALPSSHPRPPVHPTDDTVRSAIGLDRPLLVTDLNADGYPDVLLAPGHRDGSHTLMAGTATGFETVASLPEVPAFAC